MSKLLLQLGGMVEQGNRERSEGQFLRCLRWFVLILSDNAEALRFYRCRGSTPVETYP